MHKLVTDGVVCQVPGQYIGRAACDAVCESRLAARWIFIERGDVFPDCTNCGGAVTWRQAQPDELPTAHDV